MYCLGDKITNPSSLDVLNSLESNGLNYYHNCILILSLTLLYKLGSMGFQI